MAAEACGNFDVEIRHDSLKKGKGLFATRNFHAGEVICAERPLVSSQFAWNAACRYKACDHCMRSLETAEQMCQRLSGKISVELPHPECCSVRPDEFVTCLQCATTYCSENCRQEAWKQYHQSLCIDSVTAESMVHPVSRLLEAWKARECVKQTDRFAVAIYRPSGNVHYPPETCSIMLIVRMIATIKQSSDKKALMEAYGRFCRATVNEEECIAHKLLGEQFQGQLELMRTLLIEMFPNVEELQPWFTPDGFRSLFALIGTNGQGIGTSSFSVWVKNTEVLSLPEKEREELDSLIDKLYDDIDEVSGQFLDCEGSGLYSLQSSCNHSCCPNAEVSFPNNNFELTLKALSDIKSGEEIFISYLNECDIDRSRHSRQKTLRENYLFVCQCEKCISQGDQPDVTSEEEDDDDDDMDC